MILGITYTFFIYLIWIALMQSMMDVYLMRFICKPKRKSGWVWFVFVIMFAAHDLFFSMYNSVDSQLGGYPVVAVELIVFYGLLMLLMYYLVDGKVLRNFIYMLALDFWTQFIAMLITLPLFVIEIQFDFEGLTSFAYDVSIKNAIGIFVMYAAAMVLTGLIWKSAYKHRNKVFDIACIVFSGLDIIGTVFSGWPFFGICFPLYIILVVIVFNEQNAYEKQLAEQFRYYQELEKIQKKKEEDIAKIRHDIANHLNVLEEMNKEENGREILKKIDKHQGDLCGVSVVDCLIKEKIGICKEKGIIFERKISGIQKEISAYDMIGLMANLLDNAIEAAEKNEGESKYISLEMNELQGIFHIVLENGKCSDEKPLDKNLQTTKSEKRKHGYGTRIIKDVVERNDGKIEYQDLGDKMLVKVWM